MAGLGEKGLGKRDGQVGPVNPFPPRGSPLTSNLSGVRQSKITKWTDLASLGEKGLTIFKMFANKKYCINTPNTTNHRAESIYGTCICV